MRAVKKWIGGMFNASNSKEVAPVITVDCPFCKSAAHFRFELKTMQRHRGLYYECSTCECLFVDKPTWLVDAYAYKGVHIDVGQVSRSLRNWLVLTDILPLLGLGRDLHAVDLGGGEGILTRLMRDSGWRFHCYDPYHPVLFADAFKQHELASPRPDIITAFEVFEHFSSPRDEINRLLDLRPRVLVYSTWLYEQQGSDWFYLVPDVGQHIFFWSRKAMQMVADEHGMLLLTCPWFGVMVPKEFDASLIEKLREYMQGFPAAFDKLPQLVRDVAIGQGELQTQDQMVGTTMFLTRILPNLTSR